MGQAVEHPQTLRPKNLKSVGIAIVGARFRPPPPPPPPETYSALDPLG